MMPAVVPSARTLGELLGAAAGGYSRLAITDLTLDSRQVTPGAAFIAVSGARAHGLDYAAQALANGAAIVLYEPSAKHAPPREASVAVPNLKARLGELARAFYDLSPAPTLIGVTGTNGKTTVAYLIAQALGQPQRACAYVGTLGYGVPPKLVRHGYTTPDTLTLHRELAELRTARVAMEVSSHALAQERTAGLEFHTAVFTNLTRDHLDEHGDFASYGNAKRKLFRVAGLKHAIVNANDAFSHTIASALPAGCELTRTSTGGNGAELTGWLRRSDLSGLDIDVAGKFGSARLRSKLIGEFNAENLLSALGALLAVGMPLRTACAALGAAKAAPGRMDVLDGAPNRPSVVVDYAHTPDALRRVLTMLEAATIGDVWCVFGCGGERDRGKRAQMGAVAADLADRIILTDDNPRSENPAAIVAEIRAGVGEHPRVATIHDRRAAIEHAIQRARPGDVVLIAGKGHEDEQIVALERRPFDDRLVAAAALGVSA